MIPAIIFGFLVGSVLSLGFRVWILVPVTLLTIIAVTIVDLFAGAQLVAAIELGCLVALPPQLGYAFGLLARSGLNAVRSPRKRSAPMSSERRAIGGV